VTAANAPDGGAMVTVAFGQSIIVGGDDDGPAVVRIPLLEQEREPRAH
jgi:hypothetical protein